MPNRYVIPLLLVADLAFGQPSTPVFQTTFYFKDAMGNRDSIRVSGDTIFDNPGAYRGEIALAPNQAKEFEVFTIPVGLLIETPGATAGFNHGFVPVGYNFYRDVVVDGTFAFGAEYLIFLFKNKYNPVKVKWDRNFFLQHHPGLSYSNFVPDHTAYSVPMVEPPGPGDIYACLGVDSVFTVNVGVDYNDPTREIFGSFTPNGPKMYGLMLLWEPYSKCTIILSDETAPETFPTRVYPNPAKDGFTLVLPPDGLPEAGFVQVFSVTGHLVRSLSIAARQERAQIQVAGLPSGLYHYNVQMGGRAVSRGKIVVE